MRPVAAEVAAVTQMLCFPTCVNDSNDYTITTLVTSSPGTRSIGPPSCTGQHAPQVVVVGVIGDGLALLVDEVGLSILNVGV